VANMAPQISRVLMGPLVAACALVSVIEESIVATFWQQRLLPSAWVGGLIVALVMVCLIPENIP
jgi:hypothetical protein